MLFRPKSAHFKGIAGISGAFCESPKWRKPSYNFSCAAASVLTENKTNWAFLFMFFFINIIEFHFLVLPTTNSLSTKTTNSLLTWRPKEATRSRSVCLRQLLSLILILPAPVFSCFVFFPTSVKFPDKLLWKLFLPFVDLCFLALSSRLLHCLLPLESLL